MRLERLEIAGFKSFSDRSELAFDRGVTAIVGPNGCGKSNVADAITWVLGEQSAKSLRGEKMEDVIFSGSDVRKPTATAEVRLRLSGVTGANGHGIGNGNGHGHEAGLSSMAALGADGQEPPPLLARDVELVRRLYRSGESEYLIDGEQCRLRDIHELLMDTGLGAKAYAIIEQGKIGMILSSRPTDRRQLIEEAAGITKYRARRRSAELKLDAAQQNLTRIDDIVFEVEKQRGSLKRQAAKARRHQRLRDELRRWEKVQFARRSRELSSAIDSARARLDGARAREAAAAARVAELDAAVSRLRIEVAEADGHATASRERAHAHQLEIQRTEQQVALNRQQVAVLSARLDELQAEEAALAARREPQQRQLAERRGMASRAAADRDRAAHELTTENERYQLALRDVEALEVHVDRVRGESFAMMNALTTLRHAIEHAAANRERVQEALGRLEVEERDLRVETERLASDRVTAEKGLADAQAALGHAQRLRASLEERLAATRADQALLGGQLRDREHDVAGLAARLRSLEELEAGREGYTDAARMVLAQANGTVAQEGALADYLEVDRHYERAVEAALGDRLQHVLVPSQQHAVAGLELLRSEEAGRCGFVLLDSAATPSSGLTPPPGFRPLASVLRVTGPHAEAIGAVLPPALVAPSLSEGLPVARETGALVVTTDGDLLDGGRILIGGNRSDARGILATKGEIKELRARLEAGREAVTELSARVTAAQAAVADVVGGIEAAGADLHSQEKAIVGFEAQVARAHDEAVRLQRKGEVLATERRRASEEVARLDAQAAAARASIDDLQVKQQTIDGDLALAQRRLADARDRVEALSAQTAEAKAAHATLVERAAALAIDVERLDEASLELESRLAALGAEQDQKRTRRAELEVATADALARLDVAVVEAESLSAAVRDAEAAAAGLRSRVEERETSMREAREALDIVRAGIAELEVARATAESDLSHLAAACLDAVQMPLEEVLAEAEQLERDGVDVAHAGPLAVDEGGDESEEGEPLSDRTAGPAEPGRVLTAEEAIAELRAKIDRLGPVNMMAIEQFDELESRYQFLTTQRKDLVDSIAATNDAIARIDETSRVRFREAFDAINLNFQETFSTLFGGGRAGIRLLDETDPLESGIDIVASPPGKRLQSVQLLSGGEKALTAIALMFAIFKYKPSPFCLLDEIDAPLDDANIGRFVEMLKGMLHHTQFILITHNRKTMEIADRLYGVTMEEPGVSRLISVRLN